MNKTGKKSFKNVIKSIRRPRLKRTVRRPYEKLLKYHSVPSASALRILLLPSSCLCSEQSLNKIDFCVCVRILPLSQVKWQITRTWVVIRSSRENKIQIKVHKHFDNIFLFTQCSLDNFFCWPCKYMFFGCGLMR